MAGPAVSDGGSFPGGSSASHKVPSPLPTLPPVRLECLLMLERGDDIRYPAPFPAVPGVTPKEEWEEAKEAAHEREREHARAAGQAQREANKKDAALFTRVRALSKAAVSQLKEAKEKSKAGTEGALREKTHNQAQKEFATAFPEVAAGGSGQVALCRYACKVVHQGRLVEAQVFVCQSHVCVMALKPGFQDRPVREAIPFTELATVQPSIVLQKVCGVGYINATQLSSSPYIIPVPDMSIVPTCVQLFTTDGRIVQVTDICDTKKASAASKLSLAMDGTPLNRFYNWLDHTWREATAVPLPSIKYQEPQYQVREVPKPAKNAGVPADRVVGYSADSPTAQPAPAPSAPPPPDAKDAAPTPSAEPDVQLHADPSAASGGKITGGMGVAALDSGGADGDIDPAAE